jgi:hypothetical protein
MLPTTPKSSEWSLSFSFSDENLENIFRLSMRATCLAQQC